LKKLFNSCSFFPQNTPKKTSIKTYAKLITAYRDSTFNDNVKQYSDSLKNNPSDKKTVMKLASSYANLYYYDKAIEILSGYLNNVPEDSAHDVRFRYCQYTAYNYEWDKSLAQLNKLLEYDPGNPDYLLLRGQISAWTFSNMMRAKSVFSV